MGTFTKTTFGYLTVCLIYCKIGILQNSIDRHTKPGAKIKPFFETLSLRNEINFSFQYSCDVR